VIRDYTVRRLRLWGFTRAAGHFHERAPLGPQEENHFASSLLGATRQEADWK